MCSSELQGFEQGSGSAQEGQDVAGVEEEAADEGQQVAEEDQGWDQGEDEGEGLGQETQGQGRDQEQDCHPPAEVGEEEDLRTGDRQEEPRRQVK